MKIYVRQNDVNKALRILKKKMLEEGDAKILRSRQFFVSKGEEKRLAVKAGKKRWAKKQILIEKNRERKEREMLRSRRSKNTPNRNNKKNVPRQIQNTNKR
jgi:ribosomal protein S21|tara:strand:+ start:678 stop:980 length:303 start_codon:yes stop_codon:yes gene_type:complete